MVDTQRPPDATLVFMAGLAGLLGVLPAGIFGWALGNRYMRICVRRGLPAHPMARTGRVLGLVGTLAWGGLLVLGLAGSLIAYAWMR